MSEVESKHVRPAEAPKGRPTPKRSESQAQRRAMAKTPVTRKEASKRARETRRADMARQREALASGNEKYLPARDKGPVRKFVRDYVDSRWCVAEFFLPLAIVILLLSITPSAGLKNISLLLWLFVIVLIVFDSIAISVQVKKQLKARFPDESHRGARAYALMRTLQLRRMRLPKPQVKRGERP
ncbi:membrane protein [Streptomyces sp. CNQ-509]|uniref:DUF3043 domain-containing protein n=1 Tax=unclassified Streptomyces TaxID=2593676 RepID=UPI00062DE666|nr:MULTISPECIES: DUF3043 domain-containing protein [unclassified Streptomyces]AKH81991.1 membrane protein [Streptomyces sp. CNQ-509]AZM45633.1 DUF3043 domain-containing protein [Streptomyces sp. WAC 06738]